MHRMGLTYCQWIDSVRLCYASDIDIRKACLLMTTISEAVDDISEAVDDIIDVHVLGMSR